MIFNLDKNSKTNENYKLMAQTIIPRPIAWVVTEDNGVINIAPFSYFIGLSSNPATVLISVGHRADGTPKDTLANIRKHQKCTICMVDESHLEKMHFSSQALDREISEAEIFDIDTKRVVDGYPPMVSNVPVAYFCTFNQEIDIGGGSTIPIVLNVNEIFVDEKSITNHEKLTIKFKPVARVARNYAFLGEDIDAPILKESL